MWRSRLVGCAVASLLAVSAAGTASGHAPSDRGRLAAGPIQGVDSMWVWQARPAADLAATAQGLGVSRVFLFVGNPDRHADRVVKASVRRLHLAGIEVLALSGSPDWTKHHAPALEWAHRALALAPFDGLHLDVEPHALKHWKHHQQELAADYLALLEQLAPLPGPLEIDAQFAYGKVQLADGTNFADDILQRVSGVTVMSYRDTADGPNGMLAIAADWLGRATSLDRPIRLAAETNQLDDCPYCTFYEEGQAAMAAVLTAVDDAERADYPTYQGIAIEDLDGWLGLGP